MWDERKPTVLPTATSARRQYGNSHVSSEGSNAHLKLAMYCTPRRLCCALVICLKEWPMRVLFGQAAKQGIPRGKRGQI